MAARRVLRLLLSSYWLRVGALSLSPIVCVDLVLYAVEGKWPKLTLELWFTLFFVVGAISELWLRSNSGKAVMRPIAARMDKSRIGRELNKLLIGNSPSVTLIVLLSLYVVIIAAMLTVMSIIDHGFHARGAIVTLLGAWPLFAFIAGSGILWLIFYHAGIDPQRAFDRLFSWGAIGAIGFVAGMMWVGYPELGFQHRRNAQRDFHKAILSSPAPCVAVQDKLSDLSACTVFGLRPGMAQSEVLEIVNGSEYFRREKPEACRTGETCSHYVTFIKDGLYLRVEFKSDPKSAAPEERVSNLVFALDERANPYFDENQMMEKFVKLIGPNGTSIDTTQMVWIDIMNDLELRAYTYESKFWAVFSRLGDRPYPRGSGVPV